MIPLPKTKADLEILIHGKIEENINLEYKSADALTSKKEIAKDVSSMANSAGGLIIYGIKEFDDHNKKHLPEKITPIDRTRYNREWLEQVIYGNISPKIEELIIYPIQLDDINEVAYVVEIPQSTTAHQCTFDFRYYRRHNFIAEPMLDYEIRDILNRVKHPYITLDFLIEKSVNKISGNAISLLVGSIDSNSSSKQRTLTKNHLKIIPLNEGNILARFVNYFVSIPEDIVDVFSSRDRVRDEDGYIEYFFENTYRDIVDFKADPFGGITKYGPSRFDPILPGLSGRSEKILLDDEAIMDNREITWKVYADNAQKITGKIKLNDIPIYNKDDTSDE